MKPEVYAPFMSLRVAECIVMSRVPSEELVPVWRPWHRRLADWLLRRPTPMTSERLALDAYFGARYGLPINELKR